MDKLVFPMARFGPRIGTRFHRGDARFGRSQRPAVANPVELSPCYPESFAHRGRARYLSPSLAVLADLAETRAMPLLLGLPKNIAANLHRRWRFSFVWCEPASCLRPPEISNAGMQAKFKMTRPGLLDKWQTSHAMTIAKHTHYRIVLLPSFYERV